MIDNISILVSESGVGETQTKVTNSKIFPRSGFDVGEEKKGTAVHRGTGDKVCLYLPFHSILL